MRNYSRPKSNRFTFNQRALDALPPHDPDSPSRETEYTDQSCVGLQLRVSKNGRKFFQHRYRYLGRKRCLSLGEYPHVSIQDARTRVGEQRAALARDIDPADEREQRRSEPTLAEYGRDHYMPHAKQHKKTWQEDEWKIERRLIPILGHLRLSSVTTRDVAAFHSAEKSRSSAVTANHHLTLIKRMFNLAVKWGFLERSPAAGVEKFKAPPHRERYLTKEELPRFLKALEDLRDREAAAALSLALYTGCRRNEVMSLRWDQVLLDEGRLYLPITKNNRSRSVLLNPRAIKVLEELQDCGKEDEYVFPSRSGTKLPYRRDMRKTFANVCKAAGITGLRIHDLRHSFATLAIQGGASLYDVQKLLGHQDIAMTQRYAHMVDESQRRATDNMAQVIDNMVAG
ncbi:tyrosine-type recombinase/integrase [Syntrophotalea acetylenica]|uniref:Integrase n=1 Tax=Syntrophotalea acetylenica TaxID=29542 RepID=A0A1L3GEA4_SYNAC|nr:site-specific integrase [Syntrophotalea acetylenica]APG24247.1 integrase [Syntrophotalea acetylenica]APG44828.1 integrase [Syntrophotalea acetylenica]